MMKGAWWNNKKRRRRRLGSFARLVIVTLILLQQYWLAVSIGGSLRALQQQHADNDKAFSRERTTRQRRQYDTIDSSSQSSAPDATTATSSPQHEPNKKYLIFRHVFTGQGAGNVVSGLLAAHLLGIEFHRTVCVDYPSFQTAFEPLHVEECLEIQQAHPSDEDNTLKRNNYDSSGFSSECALKERLASHDKVLYYTGNTYPRWPHTSVLFHSASDLFHRFYRPTRALWDVLPWNMPPESVVHLRQADGELDERSGLDHQTLVLLGDTLPRHTYLVTNRVAWYDFFREQYGWSHPPWTLIQHSALGISWGERVNQSRSSIMQFTSSYSKQQQELQLWADWYTLLRTKTIYHTSSDFSASAARWNPSIESWTIRGIISNASDTTNATSSSGGGEQQSSLDTHDRLHLIRDNIAADILPPLVNRTYAELKFCNDSSVSQEYKDSRMANMIAMAKRRRTMLGL